MIRSQKATLQSHQFRNSYIWINYPLVNKPSYWTWPFSSLIYPLKMVMFHSCVSLPEGITIIEQFTHLHQGNFGIWPPLLTTIRSDCGTWSRYNLPSGNQTWKLKIHYFYVIFPLIQLIPTFRLDFSGFPASRVSFYGRVISIFPSSYPRCAWNCWLCQHPIESTWSKIQPSNHISTWYAHSNPMQPTKSRFLQVK